jgi:hypothetical protein
MRTMLRYEPDGKQTYKIYVNKGYGASMGNILDALSEDDEAAEAEYWIKVRRKGKGSWHLIEENLTDKKGNWIADATDLGFSRWDKTLVQSLDRNSDESQCFGMSNRLQCNGISITTQTFGASSIEELAEALSHVEFCAWCPGDI